MHGTAAANLNVPLLTARIPVFMAFTPSVGFPGIIVIEGAADDVQEYLQRIRALRWQAMSVRHQDTVQLLEGAHRAARRM